MRPFDGKIHARPIKSNELAHLSAATASEIEMTEADILGLIVRCTREVLPDLTDHQFQQADSLADLGASSVDRAEILNMVLETLSLDIPRTQLFGPSNIGELASLLLRKI